MLRASYQDFMKQLILPDLDCPFPSAINRHADAVDQAAIEWARRMGLLAAEGDYRRISAVKIGWLIGRAYPTTPLTELQLLTDWTTWGFLWDDQCGQPGIGDQPERLATIHTRFVDVLKGAQPTLADGSLVLGLYDLRERIRERAAPAAMARFVNSVEEFFAACVWEATNRKRGITPDLATYIKMRPFSGGLYTYIELIEIIEQMTLPPRVREHPTVQRLTLTANNVVCWTNDIVSLGKELKQGDVHNLVLALQHKHRLTLQEAMDRAAALHAAEVRSFIDLELRLPSFGRLTDAQLKAHVSVLRSWMRGNLDWSYTSGRYLQAPLVMAG